MDSECWGTWGIIFKPSQASCSKHFPGFFRMKTRTNFLRKDWGSGRRERGKRSRPLLSHGSSSGKLKAVPPLCECSFLQMLGPDAVHLLGVRRKPPEHMAAHISLHPGTDWGSRSPGLCFQSCDSSCEKPRGWQALSSLLTSQRESGGELQGAAFIRRLCLDSRKGAFRSLVLPTARRC